MVYDETTLAQDIIERCEDKEIIGFFEEKFEYDDALVIVDGDVAQYFEYHQGDYYTPSVSKLTERSATLYIRLIKDKEDRYLTDEEVASIEKMIKNVYL